MNILPHHTKSTCPTIERPCGALSVALPVNHPLVNLIADDRSSFIESREGGIATLVAVTLA
jgi:hypothetical protein